ncbi:MAG: riboflavin biosynthesis protein RibF [Rickettsiales bacterium]|nr:riboflavin biosynthesis protein RibF [Rickettsiales bacterium]|tara:strand:- start:1265 stop:2200 length:936 start_codon:yes stop_codon:yes gene_type:complete
MKVFRSFSIPKKFNDSVIAIGNFDGLHLGHLEVINEAKKISLDLKKKVGVMTFEPHPKSFFRKKYEFFRLTPFRMKYELLKKKELDFMLNIKFDRSFMKISSLNFIEKILLKDLKASHIVTGFDFVFGNKQTGNVDVLRNFCESSKKLKFTEIEEKKIDGSEVSSSLIRDLLRVGKIEKANKILSRKWTVVGRILKGEKKAREIGFKTANMSVNSYCDICYGVYAVLIQLPEEISEKKFYGIANYGVKPTFKKKNPILEVHIFDFSKEIYGKKIKVSFLKFIRKEKKFESVEKLKDQIIKDIKLVKKNGIF